MCCKSRDQPHTLPVSPTCFDIGNFGSAAAPEGPTCPGGPCKRPAAAPGTGPKALLGLVRGKSFASPPSLSVLELFPWVIPLGFFFSTCGSSVTTNGCVSRSPAEQFGVKRLGMGQLLLQQCCREVWPELRGTLLARSFPSPVSARIPRFWGVDFTLQLPGSCWVAAQEICSPPRCVFALQLRK